MEKCGLRFQSELPLAGTVVAWYAIDRADRQAGQATARPLARTARWVASSWQIEVADQRY
jgi:hypothetical protein